MEKNIKLSELVFFIPARSGSTRVKNKNLKIFKKKSLIVNKIKTCLSTKLGYVFVSTDSKKIANIATQNKAIILKLRCNELSNSKASMISSVVDFVKTLEDLKIKKPKYIAIVPVTTPLLRKKTIISAFNKLKKNKKYNSITSTVNSKVNPFNLIKNKKNKILFDIFTHKNVSFKTIERSQDSPKFMKISSAIQITKTKYFDKFKRKFLAKLLAKPFDVNSCTYLNIDSFEDYDINTIDDYSILKTLTNRESLLKKITKKFF